jgi:hypothetical protein
MVGYRRFSGQFCLHFILMMEAASSTETSASYHITIMLHNPDNHDLNLHLREDLKSRKNFMKTRVELAALNEQKDLFKKT